MNAVDVMVVGAGPYGLSISAHLRALGIQHTVVGRPMATWKENMPTGMLMRSEPYGSDMSSPRADFDMRGYCDRHGVEYVHRLGPLTLQQFLDYADWYTDELVPSTLDDIVTGVARTSSGYRVEFAESGPVLARTVVLAPGLTPFKVVPSQLQALPADLVTHVSEHRDLTVFQGRKVAVVGGGQSALETLALLHETGADAQLVMRKKSINWLEANPAELSRLGHLRRPTSKLCEGWHCSFWNTPELFRTLPRDVRVLKSRSVLGPAGGWWLRDRVEGVIPTHTGHEVRSASKHRGGVRLVLEGPSVDLLDVDHVIAATGFRVDVNRLEFLDKDLRLRLDTEAGYPVLDRTGESSAAGLYFAGAPAAVSLGPSMRFIAGTHNQTRRLARQLARRVTSTPRPAGRVSRRLHPEIP